MDIILSEKDLDNAVKLYLAFSGVTRKVSALEWARKLKGNDAGISVSIEMDGTEMSEQALQDLAMSQKRANMIESRKEPVKRDSVEVPDDPATDEDEPNQITQELQAKAEAGKAAKAALVETVEVIPPTEAGVDLGEGDDEQIPFTSLDEDALLAQAEKAYPDNPFADHVEQSAEEEASAEVKAELGNDLPDASPFAEMESTSEEAAGVKFEAPVESDNPFADDSPVQPVVPEAEETEEPEQVEETPVPVNLFG